MRPEQIQSKAMKQPARFGVIRAVLDVPSQIVWGKKTKQIIVVTRSCFSHPGRRDVFLYCSLTQHVSLFKNVV